METGRNRASLSGMRSLAHSTVVMTPGRDLSRLWRCQRYRRNSSPDPKHARNYTLDNMDEVLTAEIHDFVMVYASGHGAEQSEGVMSLGLPW